MSEKRHDEFRVLVKAAHSAIDEFAEARLADGGRDWFAEGLDCKVHNAVYRLLAFGVTSSTAFDERAEQFTKTMTELGVNATVGTDLRDRDQR